MDIGSVFRGNSLQTLDPTAAALRRGPIDRDGDTDSAGERGVEPARQGAGGAANRVPPQAPAADGAPAQAAAAGPSAEGQVGADLQAAGLQAAITRLVADLQQASTAPPVNPDDSTNLTLEAVLARLQQAYLYGAGGPASAGGIVSTSA